MTEIAQYLAEEIALDFADGHIPRREAVRRLLLLGVTAATATSMLAGCSSEQTGAGAPSSQAEPTGSQAASPSAAASQTIALPPSSATEAITFAGPEGRKLQGAFANADKPKGGVLVIHENKGISDHFRHVAGRFAAVGYSALAIDLLSEEGGTASLGDPANATAALGKIAPERFVGDMRAGLDELAKRAPKVKLGAIGFCFGGGMTWRLVASKDPRLAAAAPFYGPLPDGADFNGSKAAVLAVYAELDARVNGSKEAAETALKKAGLTYELAMFAGADHAFFNDTGKRYHAESATKAWAKVLEWFGKHLG